MDYSERFVKNVSRRKGVIINMRTDEVLLPNGKTALREVIEHPGAVAVLPLDAEGFSYCVRQFRYPVNAHLLEIPAGKLDPGEEHAACAARELSEETGIEAGRLIYLGVIYTSPGFCDEAIHLYLALDLEFKNAHPDEDEFLDVEKISFDTLVEMAMSGEIPDAKTTAAVLKAKRYLEV